MHKLYILHILFTRCNRNPIIQLLTKGADCIINEYDVGEGNISEDAQIFDVNVVCRLDALVSVEPMLAQSAVGVQIVQYRVRIARVARSEHAHLVVPIGNFEDFPNVGPDVEPGIQKFARGGRHLQNTSGSLVGFLCLTQWAKVSSKSKMISLRV
jgi:hypothetical protein